MKWRRSSSREMAVLGGVEWLEQAMESEEGRGHEV